MKPYRVFLAVAIILAVARPALAALTNRFVVKDNGGQAEPFDTWENAAADIQTAINYAQVGETVLVAAATYDTGGLTNYPAGGLLTNRVAIWKAITVMSAGNDPANTIIRGAWDPAAYGLGPAAVRCVYMTNSSTLIGFTLTNGATLASPAASGADVTNGAGAWSQKATLSNCVIIGNSAAGLGGGVFKGNVYNCTVANNFAGEVGGGVMGAFLNGSGGYFFNCLLTGNYSRGLLGGGASYGGSFYNCAIISNRSDTYGGGAAQSNFKMYNCTVAGNSANGNGGGGYSGEMYNCAVYGNSGNYGGAGHSVKFYNCTVIGNNSVNEGATYGGQAVNSIVYFNKGSAGYDNWTTTSYYTNSCTYPADGLKGTGNITNDPMFVVNGSDYGTNHVAGNYRLSAGSTCVDYGIFFPWMTNSALVYSKDLDGRMRVRYGAVDLGAFEFITKGAVFSLH